MDNSMIEALRAEIERLKTENDRLADENNKRAGLLFGIAYVQAQITQAPERLLKTIRRAIEGVPAPGTPEALSEGCLCEQSAAIKATYRDGHLRKIYEINEKCPMHTATG